MSKENIDDLLAEFDAEDRALENKLKKKQEHSFYDSVRDANKEIQPLGFNETPIYPDNEVSDYFDSDDEEISLDGLAMRLKDREPPGLNDGILRRNNAAIYMPMRLPSLYG